MLQIFFLISSYNYFNSRLNSLGMMEYNIVYYMHDVSTIYCSVTKDM